MAKTFKCVAKIEASGSGVDSKRGCNCVDHVLVDFDGGRVVPGYITKMSRTHFRNDLVVKYKILCDILY